VTDLPQTISEAQRAFIAAADALGATEAAHARRLQELPRLSNRELDALVDVGVVREAAESRYYVFRPRRTAVVLPAAAGSGAPESFRTLRPAWPVKRFFPTLIFWLLVVLIPIILLRLTVLR
jgi:hypothetical protein